MNTVVWNESVHEQLIIREIRGLCDEGEDIIMEFNHGVLFSDTYQKKLKSVMFAWLILIFMEIIELAVCAVLTLVL